MSNFFDFNKSFSPVDEESELIPLMTSDDEEAINKEKLPKNFKAVAFTKSSRLTIIEISKEKMRIINNAWGQIQKLKKTS